MLHGPRLRNRGGKCEFITVIIVNDHYGFAFDFHFVQRGPASGGHFPFYEVPTEYVADIRKFRRLLRTRNG
jgi:hypothetical protein